MHHKYYPLLGIFCLGLVISITLTAAPTPAICDPNEGCDTVLTSPQAFMFFGIKNSAWGIGAFALLSGATIYHLKKPRKETRHFIHLGVILGTLYALYFIYLQTNVLHAYCKYCMTIDLAMIVALGITIKYWKE